MYKLNTPKWLLYTLIILYIVTISLTLMGWNNFAEGLDFSQISLCIIIYAIGYLIFFINIEEFYSRNKNEKMVKRKH